MRDSSRNRGGRLFGVESFARLAIGDFGFTRPSLHVERDEFDEILLRAAQRRGANVFEDVSVRHVHLDGSLRGVTYEDRQSGEQGQIRCRYVVDGSGQGAVIANQLGFREFDKGPALHERVGLLR